MTAAELQNPSDLITVAQAIADTTNDNNLTTWAAPFQAVRSYADWDEKLEAFDTLHVDVVPVGFTRSELADRGHIEHDIAVDIGVRQRFSQEHQDPETGRLFNAPLDVMSALLQQLAEYWMKDRLTKHPGDCEWQETVIRTPYARDHLREHRQFTGIIRITHQVTKVLP